MNLSNTQINKIGFKIRQNDCKPKNDTIIELQNYRTSYRESLSEIFNLLLLIKNKNNYKDAILTYRIKRFESIIGKLKRYGKMKLSRMWDIGGCRIILNDVKDVYTFRDEIEKVLNIRKVYDYIKEPQKEGYQSLHLFIDSPVDNKVIELQLRCKKQHNWATLVEISDLIYDSGLKEFNKDKSLLRFHFLLSKKETNIKEKKEIALIIKKYKYSEKLNSIFNRNYLDVRLQWLLIENEYKHRYFLIETKKNEIPIIEAFSDFKEAEKEYFNKFKENDNANVVLTYLLRPKFEQISMAYSNYILTMHSFLNNFYEIFEILIVESIKEKKYIDYLKFLSQYQEISIRKYANFTNESNLTNLLKQNKFSQLDKKIVRKITKKIKIKNKEWESSIRDEIKKSNNSLKRLSILINKNSPKSKIRRYIFKRITDYTVSKYTKKYKELLKV